MLHPAKTGFVYRFLLARLPSRRLRVTFSMAALLIVILVVTIYKAIVPAPPDYQKMEEWEYYHVWRAYNVKKEPFSLKKYMNDRWGDVQTEARKCWLKWKIISGPPQPPFANVVITESWIGPSPNKGAYFSVVTDMDAEAIIHEYGETPFFFSHGNKINVEQSMAQLVKNGYQPVKGVYDASSPERDLEGFSIPFRRSCGGLAILVRDGRIAQIRKLRNYNQYLTAREKKTDYTGIGQQKFCLPDLRKQDKGEASFTHPEIWHPELIAYAYIAEELSVHYPSSQDSNLILKKALQEAYLEEADAPWLYLSVSREDQKEIIREYGEKPFKLRFKDKIDQAAVIRQLKDAGYHPRDIGYGFSFPLKNSIGGYKVFVQDGEIYQIRKLWSYEQYLRNPVDYKYTTDGVLLFYLPDLTKKAITP